MTIDNDMLSRALDKTIEEYIKENDFEKVKHGKWRESRFGNGITVPFSKYYICDQCNHTSQKKSHYCPNCGAKMIAIRRKRETVYSSGS